MPLSLVRLLMRNLRHLLPLLTVLLHQGLKTSPLMELISPTSTLRQAWQLPWVTALTVSTLHRLIQVQGLTLPRDCSSLMCLERSNINTLSVVSSTTWMVPSQVLVPIPTPPRDISTLSNLNALLKQLSSMVSFATTPCRSVELPSPDISPTTLEGKN